MSSNEIPSVLEFYSPDCAHCKKLEPEYAACANFNSGSYNFYKVDATEADALSLRFSVISYPTIFVIYQSNVWLITPRYSVESIEESLRTFNATERGLLKSWIKNPNKSFRLTIYYSMVFVEAIKSPLIELAAKRDIPKEAVELLLYGLLLLAFSSFVIGVVVLTGPSKKPRKLRTE
jgi:thiol-disulfide isomerase/thioredoxin